MIIEVSTKLKRCPKCGSYLLALGKPFKCTTPKIVRFFRGLHGVSCVKCGFYKPTKRAGNRSVDDA